MKTTTAFFSTLAKVSLVALAAIATEANSTFAFAQSTSYFDQNGTTQWFGIAPNGNYDWDGAAIWNSSDAGTSSTAPWVDGNHAYFLLAKNDGVGFANTETINVHLRQAVTVGNGVGTSGITLTRGVVNLWAQTATTLDLNGASINVSGATTDNTNHSGLIIGDNVNLIGDFAITTPGNHGSVKIVGEGDDYTGTITIDTAGGGTNAGFFWGTGTRVAASTRFVINKGGIRVFNSQTATIAELSGTGGHLSAGSTGVSNTHWLIVDQATNTSWGGSVGSYLSLGKKGSGRLSLTGTTAHTSRQTDWNVEEGSLYVAAELVNHNNTTGDYFVNVSSGATFGGTVTANRRVKLLASESQLDAGMFEEVGTMNLSAGLIASEGGIFSFDLNGADASRINIGNVLNLGTSLVLNGQKRVNLVQIGDLEDVILNTPYLLMDATHASGLWDEDESNWTFQLQGFGALANNAVWSLDNRQLSIAFIPEPSSLLLMSLSFAVCLVGIGIRRRNTTPQ